MDVEQVKQPNEQQDYSFHRVHVYFNAHHMTGGVLIAHTLRARAV